MHTREILSEHSQVLIENGMLQELAPIFHDLDASAVQQKRAMQNNMIVLSSWELLVFSMFKSLTELSRNSVSSFPHMHYFESNLAFTDDSVDRVDSDEKVRRLLTQFKMDKNRMLVILLTRLLQRLILKASDAID